jgi:glycine/D-amino acid oxidase-like deaminating enzyme
MKDPLEGRFLALPDRAEVVIIGGGLTGLTTAYLLGRAGVRVVLLEKDRCGKFDTGRSTAHLSYVTDRRLQELVRNYGAQKAKGLWEAGRSGIDLVHELSIEVSPFAGFTRVPGFLQESIERPPGADLDSLKKDFDLAQQLGFETELLGSTPFSKHAGIRFARQAKIDPILHASGMKEAVVRAGAQIFEECLVEVISPDNGIKIRGRERALGCEALVIAAVDALPLAAAEPARALLKEMSFYTSYVIEARVEVEWAEGLYWDLSRPYYHLRVDEIVPEKRLLFGGCDSATGEKSSQAYDKLRTYLNHFAGGVRFVDQWAGQIVQTESGFPIVRELPKKVFVAVAFCGNGLTLGTVGAASIAARILGQPSPWLDRLKPN